MTITEIESEITEEFEMFSDWMEKYNYIIELGKSLPLIEPQFKKDNYLISGCQSQVWLHAELNNQNHIIFKADSDAIITKGLVAILIRVLSDQSPDDIINAELNFIEQTGIREHFSPTRANGLNSMIKQMKMYALAFKTKINN